MTVGRPPIAPVQAALIYLTLSLRHELLYRLVLTAFCPCDAGVVAVKLHGERVDVLQISKRICLPAEFAAADAVSQIRNASRAQEIHVTRSGNLPFVT